MYMHILNVGIFNVYIYIFYNLYDIFKIQAISIQYSPLLFSMVHYVREE